ncbi:MAG: hypothetical protein PUI81_09230 [Veillonellaceae bacterium]|nr:hypothetical protein [Veillonellaceae bacterium]
MTEKEFIDGLFELMDAEEEFTMDTKLDDIPEWDSLSFVSFQANVKVKLGKKLVPQSVKDAKTVRDLYDLVK